MKKILFIIGSFVLLLLACSKEEEQPVVSWENDYYPIKIGWWISYQVEEITIDKESAVNDTLRYQIKNVIADCIEENTNYKSYRVEEYKRTSSKNEWQHYRNWELKHYSKSIHIIKNNIEIISLINPVRLNDTWDGNAYNSEEKEEYKLKSIKDSLLNKKTRKIAQVEHDNMENLIEKIYAIDEFAKDIGLVKKVNIDVELNIDPDKSWEEKITKGTIYYQTFLAFGDE